MHNIYSAPASFCPAIIGQSIDANVVNEEEKGTSQQHAPSTAEHIHKLARYGFGGKASDELWNFETNQASTRT